MKHILSTITTVAAALLIALIAHLPARGAGIVSVDFTGATQTNMLVTEVAGVAPYARDHWVPAAGAAGSMNNLPDETGTQVFGLSVGWSATNVADNFFPNGTGDQHMMKGYLTTNPGFGGLVTINFTVPPSFGPYKVVAYMNINDINAGWEGNYTGNGQTINARDNTFDTMGMFLGGWDKVDNANVDYTGNWMEWGPFSSGQSFNLTAVPFGAGAVQAGINGIQIIPVPEPGGAASALCAGVLLSFRRRRK